MTGNHHQLDGTNVTEESRGILQAIVHPSYDDVTRENDIALLRLDRPAPTEYEGSSIIATIPQPYWTPNSKLRTEAIIVFVH